MNFQELLNALRDLIQRPDADVEVTAPVSEDSRAIQPGGVFVAHKGANFDGHNLIDQAVTNGAVAVVGERPPDKIECPVPYAQVSDSQMALGPLASAYYDYPSRKLVVIGVTGTDGKTTTSTLIYNILKAANIHAGMINTVSAIIGDDEVQTGLHVTTPPADEVQMYLRRMVEAGMTHCVLETTSHGLAQGRVNGVAYDVAVLTNVTHEHLDFHSTFESYRAAKGVLFKSLSRSFRKPGVAKSAIVNGSDPNADFFLAFAADQHLTYGIDANFTVSCTSPGYDPQYTEIDMHGPWSPDGFLVQTPLVGEFNVENILAATAAAYALGCAPEYIKAGIETMPPVPGRMERIDEGQEFLAVVDFAHTPNALRQALAAARMMIAEDRRVICVFGSAGLRDREKRRLMAEISATLADISVFTAEDPRTEPLDQILEAMADGAIAKGGSENFTFHRVPDRGRALYLACKLARPGDMVIACGKGHEQSMCFGAVEYAWDDREAMRAALRGHPLRTLPTAQ